MDREALRRLSRDELIELVDRLSEMVAASGQQQERLAALDSRPVELQAEVERLERTAEDVGERVGATIRRVQSEPHGATTSAGGGGRAPRNESPSAGTGRDRALPVKPVRGVWRAVAA